MKEERWIAKRMERVLPVPVFHVVFTLPSELRPIVRQNLSRLYDLLFTAASETLLVLAQDRLGARLGITAVLHTWTRKMLFHPHVHCIVTAGGLSLDRGAWVAGNEKCLFPVAVMRELFRGKFLSGLHRAWLSENLTMPEDRRDLYAKGAWSAFKNNLYAKDWVVHIERPMGGPEHIYEYLGRYTHRVAISSSRLLSVTDSVIRIRTRGDAFIDLSPKEFIRRMLLHVLPKRFRKIRHYGLYAPGDLGASRLRRARELLAERAPSPVRREAWEAIADGLLAGVRRCARCGGPTEKAESIPRTYWVSQPAKIDTS
jgi:hypothetical protein